jgi:hypothetical protein
MYSQHITQISHAIMDDDQQDIHQLSCVGINRNDFRKVYSILMCLISYEAFTVVKCVA